MNKWFISKLGKEISEMSLEHVVVSESKEVLKKEKYTMKKVCQRDTGANLKSSKLPNLEQFQQQNKQINK